MADDKAILGRYARALVAAGGTCRYCGCHGESCATDTGERCSWMNNTRTVCSGKACVIRWHRESGKGFKRRRRRAA